MITILQGRKSFFAPNIQILVTIDFEVMHNDDNGGLAGGKTAHQTPITSFNCVNSMISLYQTDHQIGVENV